MTGLATKKRVLRPSFAPEERIASVAHVVRVHAVNNCWHVPDTWTGSSVTKADSSDCGVIGAKLLRSLRSCEASR